MLMDIHYEIQDSFEELLSDEHRTFIHVLRVVEEHLPPMYRRYAGTGRKAAYDDLPMVRCQVAMALLRLETVRDLRSRLLGDRNLRDICALVAVPSEATFSRRFAEFAESRIMDHTLEPLVKSYLGGKVVGHISRDSTAIQAREKAQNTRKEVAPVKKKGRPKKGQGQEKQPGVLEMQVAQTPEQALARLDRECGWGCKRNSQGNVSFWKGYKLHLDVTDMGIPVSAVVTSANVHDSQAAIPLEKMTSRRVCHLYSLMDSAYDAAEIRRFIADSGRVAVIDPNKRRKQQRRLDPAQKQRFKVRSTVERSNSHLKDWLLPHKILVRGHAKVSHVLMTATVCLAALQILRHIILPQLERAA